MPQTISTICRLTFATDIDKNKILRVPDPADNTTVNDIQTAANLMISANIFDTESGSLMQLNRAEIIKSIEIELF